jgi:hypothetical protein
MSSGPDIRPADSRRAWGGALRILPRFYTRDAHSVVEVNPMMEHESYRRLILTPSGGL